MRNGMLMLATLAISAVGCNGTVIVNGGYVFGQPDVRNWLGFKPTDVLTAPVISARVLERYPLGTSIADISSEAQTAGMSQGDRCIVFGNEQVTTFFDPKTPEGSCFVRDGDFIIKFTLNDQDETTKIEVFECLTCL